MDLKVEREVSIDVAGPELRDRLARWATSSGFVCTSDLSGSWAFTRGSQLGALVAFDLRKHPTEAVVRHDADRKSVYCSMRVTSPLTITTGGDSKRMEEQVNLLIAHVKGAL